MYDMWGVPAALLRGLWAPVFSATTLTLTPAVPGNVTSLQQLFPLLWGDLSLLLSWQGTGPITSVVVDGAQLDPSLWNATTIELVYASLPAGVWCVVWCNAVCVGMGWEVYGDEVR